MQKVVVQDKSVARKLTPKDKQVKKAAPAPVKKPIVKKSTEKKFNDKKYQNKSVDRVSRSMNKKAAPSAPEKKPQADKKKAA